MSIGFNSVSCAYQSKEDNWLFRSNINFNYKNDEVTRLSMRLEYSADSSKYKDEFSDIYNKQDRHICCLDPIFQLAGTQYDSHIVRIFRCELSVVRGR